MNLFLISMCMIRDENWNNNTIVIWAVKLLCNGQYVSNRRILKVIRFFFRHQLFVKSMMAPWDSNMRWQFGGNFQRVRLICELNWKECPLAIVNHIWSEIVTDVVECVTNEGILLRIIILLLVCTILLHTIWTRTQWITDSIVSKDSLNRIDFKVQDLELRVNVLTYKMQYGAWPSPQQINDTDIGTRNDDVKLSLSSSGSRRYSWLNHCLGRVQFKNRHISRSENLGLRLRKPKTLIETSRKIYYNRPSEIRELQIFKDTSNTCSRYEKLDKMVKVPKTCMEKYGGRRKHSISERSLKTPNNAYLSLESVHDNVPVTTTAESSCEDSGNPLSDSRNIAPKLKMGPRPITIKKFSTFNCSASSKRINSTQETLANVKERLENLHTVLKIYESQHNLESSQVEDVREESAEAVVQDYNLSRTEIEDIHEKSTSNVTSEPAENSCEKGQHAKIESIIDGSNEIERTDGKKDEEKNYQVIKTNDGMKCLVLMDTDEDLGSRSSPPEPSKGGSDSDKSTQSSDALMLNALLNQLDLSNLKRWNDKSAVENTEDDSECDTENIFPKMKNFYQSKLLDIISEEQSGSSCTEKASKTIVHPKILPNESASLPNSQFKLNEKLSDRFCLPEFDIKNDRGNLQIPEETKNIRDDVKFDNNERAPKLSNILLEAGSPTTFNTVKSIGPWEKLVEYSSEESIGNYTPNIKTYHSKSENDNIESTLNNVSELDNIFDIQNGEQLIDISNLTLKRRPGVFAMEKLTKTPECDNQTSQHQDNDLIDLNFDDNENMISREIFSNESDVPLSLMDATDDISSTKDIKCLDDNVPLTSRTVICTEKIHDDNNTRAEDDIEVTSNQRSDDICPMISCKNTTSRNLIELERIAYEEMTQVENSWDSEWTSKNSYDEISTTDVETSKEKGKKLQSHRKKSPLNILSSPSSVYLTVQGSFSDMSIDCNQCLESIDKIEMPEEVRNIDNVGKHITGKSESIIIEPHAHFNCHNKSGHERITKSNDGKDNEDEECTVISKDSALSETPQQSIIAADNTDSNEQFLNVEISSTNSSSETSSYADADSHNLIFSSGVSLSFDPPELSQSLDKVEAPSSSSSKKTSTNASVNSIKTAKERRSVKKIESKTSDKPKVNNKKQGISVKAKSNLNLARENSMNLQPERSDKRPVEFGQRRSKSYIAPRKHEISLKYLSNSRDSSKVRPQNSTTKFDLYESRMTESKNNLIDRRSNSKMKFDRANSFSKSHESVNKTTSKSCIPVLKTRLDATKNIDSRPRSPLRGRLTMSVDVERNSMEVKKIERAFWTDKNDNGDNETKVRHERIDNVVVKKHPLIVPEGQTVIYVNIITDHDNCVTKVVDPKKFLECVKDKDFNIQEIVNENYCNSRDENNTIECSNAKFVTVISATGKNPVSFYRQREIEVLAKPSVIDTSTSISDIPKNDTQLEELTNDEYKALLRTLEQPPNLYEYQKIHQACSKLESDSQE